MLQRVAVIVHRKKRSEHFELRAGVLRIGSAAHCDVRLLPDEAGPEQLLIEATERGVVLCNLSRDQPVLLDGRPLVAAALLEATVRVELGPLTLSIQPLGPEVPGADAGQSLFKRVRQAALVIGVAVAYYAVLHEEPKSTAFDYSVPTPQLFEAQAGTACRYRDEPGRARAFAEEQLAAAEGKRERSPYDIREGVQAVPLYDAATACLSAIGDQAAAHESHAARQQLARRLQEDLRAHQVRLEWALERRRFAAAVPEVRAMRELLDGRRDPHAQWIAAVSRELRAVVPK
ncbi:MAG: FHA domain-containing protein [Polyangiales bacterium]